MNHDNYNIDLYKESGATTEEEYESYIGNSINQEKGDLNIDLFKDKHQKMNTSQFISHTLKNSKYNRQNYHNNINTAINKEVFVKNNFTVIKKSTLKK